MKIAVIGCGHWGKNLVRNFYELGSLYAICDSHLERIDSFYRDDNKIKLFSDFNELIKDPELEGIVIATPTDTHFNLLKTKI